VWDVPAANAIRLPEELPDNHELRARRNSLAAFVERNKTRGFLVGDGLEDGRQASPAEVDRLSGGETLRNPAGLIRCDACGRLRGELLAVKGEGWP
jgi:hypothetical protein